MKKVEIEDVAKKNKKRERERETERERDLKLRVLFNYAILMRLGEVGKGEVKPQPPFSSKKNP